MATQAIDNVSTQCNKVAKSVIPPPASSTVNQEPSSSNLVEIKASVNALLGSVEDDSKSGNDGKASAEHPSIHPQPASDNANDGENAAKAITPPPTTSTVNQELSSDNLVEIKSSADTLPGLVVDTNDDKRHSVLVHAHHKRDLLYVPPLPPSPTGINLKGVLKSESRVARDKLNPTNREICFPDKPTSFEEMLHARGHKLENIKKFRKSDVAPSYPYTDTPTVVKSNCCVMS